jgi:hypothetical protein
VAQGVPYQGDGVLDQVGKGDRRQGLSPDVAEERGEVLELFAPGGVRLAREPELDELTGQERNKVYRMLTLEVTPTT